jgi:hypothetical protein
MRTLWAWLVTHRKALGAAAVALAGVALDSRVQAAVPSWLGRALVVFGVVAQAFTHPVTSPPDA